MEAWNESEADFLLDNDWAHRFGDFRRRRDGLN
jgi:hypothetical protein